MTDRRDFILAETNWGYVKDNGAEVAILPWGATEAHNRHLPYSTDCVQVQYIVEKAAELAWEKGARPMVLPVVPFGVQTAQLEVPFNLNMRPSTQLAVLRDLVEALDKQRLRKLLIVNGHGGNGFVPLLRELHGITAVRIFTANWYDAVDSSSYFSESGDHAGEMESSVMMHIAPKLVRPLVDAGPGRCRRLKVPTLREGWAWTQRDWLGIVTEDTGVGDPSKASAEKGARYLEAIIAKVAKLIEEIAQLDLADPYEPQSQ